MTREEQEADIDSKIAQLKIEMDSSIPDIRIYKLDPKTGKSQ